MTPDKNERMPGHPINENLFLKVNYKSAMSVQWLDQRNTINDYF